MNKENINNIESDEIDLIELILSIWKKKWWVVLTTIIFAAGSIGYALMAKEQWTSKAEVITPYDYEISNVLRDQLTFSHIIDGKPDELKNSIYNSFMTELRSINSRANFFKQSNVYKKLTETMSEDEKISLLQGFASKAITIQWPDKKKNIDYPTISLSMGNPADAQMTLQEYIKYINTQVLNLYKEGFVVNLNNKILGLEFSLNRMEERLPLNRKILLERQLKNLEHALATAKAAGIKEYARTNNGLVLDNKTKENVASSKVENNESIVLMPGEEALQAQISTRFAKVDEWFLLGEKYLQAKINTLDKTPLIFPENYYHEKKQLAQLKKLRQDLNSYENDQAFHYQSAPYLPAQRDKPKRALIVLIGTFAGGVLGMLIALLMSAVESHKRRKRLLK